MTNNCEVWGRVWTFSEAERTVRYALKYGFLSPQRAEQIRRLFADG
ncbi:MAG: hypothetical protein FWD55_08975 [Propionibacteriaceae bacterium]|nr:hypothetical protein [Propionibacteriaceae bacterium]